MKKIITGLATGIFILSMVGMVGAALNVRGSGTITNNSGQYQLIYDSELGITWLDYTKSGDDWYDQMAWANDLEVSINGQIYDDWRLPQTLPVDGVSYGDYGWEYDGSADQGYNVSAPGSAYPGSTGSEMAYLYYNTLGNLGYYDISGNGPQPDWGLQNTGPFENLQDNGYWSGTSLEPYFGSAWIFYFNDGLQEDAWRGDDWHGFTALAVHTGDIAIVPEPISTILFLIGGVTLGARRFIK